MASQDPRWAETQLPPLMTAAVPMASRAKAAQRSPESSLPPLRTSMGLRTSMKMSWKPTTDYDEVRPDVAESRNAPWPP